MPMILGGSGTISSDKVSVDANGNFGVGISSPVSRLSLLSTGPGVAINFNSNGLPQSITRGGLINYWNDGSSYYNDFWNWESNGVFRVGTNATERMRIDASGRVTKPSQPAFSGVRNSNPTNTLSNSLVIFNQVNLNVGSHYNASTGYFTCPVAGYYLMSVGGHAENVTLAQRIQLRLNGTNVRYTYNAIGTANYLHHSVTSIISCNANDTLSAYVEGTFWTGDLSGIMMDIYLLG